MGASINRRSFLARFGFGAAAASVPAGCYAAAQMPAKAVAPVLLERECDNNKKSYTAAEIADIEREMPYWRWGCGTRFQWYWGSTCCCPNCGYLYIYTMEMLKAGKYRATM